MGMENKDTVSLVGGFGGPNAPKHTHTHFSRARPAHEREAWLRHQLLSGPQTLKPVDIARLRAAYAAWSRASVNVVNADLRRVLADPALVCHDTFPAGTSTRGRPKTETWLRIVPQPRPHEGTATIGGSA